MNVDSVTLKVRLDVHGDAYEQKPGQAPALPLNRGEEASLVVPTTVGAGPHMKRRRVKVQTVEGGTLHLDPEDAAFSYRLNDLD